MGALSLCRRFHEVMFVGLPLIFKASWLAETLGGVAPFSVDITVTTALPCPWLKSPCENTGTAANKATAAAKATKRSFAVLISTSPVEADSLRLVPAAHPPLHTLIR
jgi:hypothetical protein